MFELVPPDHLVRGLRDGTLRAATPARGDASVIIKSVKDGRGSAGKYDLKKVKPQLLGPAVWQALAMATQQHYLVEVSSKLDGIQSSVDEVLDRMNDDRIGTLRHVAELVEDAQATARHDGALSPARIGEVREAARDAKELWHQIATTARRHTAQYAAGTTTAEQVEETFATFAHATRVLAHCSDALAALPYGTEAELREAFAEEQDRMFPALPEFLELCAGLKDASDAWGQRHAEYREHLPTSRAAKLMRLPAIEIKRARGLLGIERHFEPEQHAMPESRTQELADLIEPAPDDVPVIVAEVQPDSSVLIGPARKPA